MPLAKDDGQASTTETRARRRSILDPGKPVPPSEGYWPTWLKKYLNDWATAKHARPRDGIIPPELDDPAWLDRAAACTKEILEAARRRHERAEARIDAIERRAARLSQTALTLITLALLAAGFIADSLRVVDPPTAVWVFGLLLAVLPIGFFIMSLGQSLGIDRVSLVNPPEPGLAAAFEDESEQRRNLTRQETRAAATANWTAGKKVNEFLQARAWLTRAVTALIGSALMAGALWWFR